MFSNISDRRIDLHSTVRFWSTSSNLVELNRETPTLPLRGFCTTTFLSQLLLWCSRNCSSIEGLRIISLSLKSSVATESTLVNCRVPMRLAKFIPGTTSENAVALVRRRVIYYFYCLGDSIFLGDYLGESLSSTPWRWPFTFKFYFF